MVTYRWQCTIVAGLTLTAAYSVVFLSVHGVAAQYPWNYEPVADDGGDLSIAIDSTGRVHAAFARAAGSSYELVYALRTGGSWSFQRVDALSMGPSLVLDPSEAPHISYYRESDNTVRYAYRVGAFFFNETVEQVNCTAYITSLAMDTKGMIHITYWNYCTSVPPFWSYLQHATRNGSGWTIETVGKGWPFPGDIAPIVVDCTGHPHIAVLRLMEGAPPGGLRYLSWNGSGWSNQQANAPSDGSALEDLSLKLDSNDVPHIVYSDATKERHRYARYDAMFKAWLHQDVYVWPPSSFHIGFGRISLALDWRDLPSVSFMDHTDGSLMYAYSDGTHWFAENVQSSPGISGHLTLGLDPLGAPHILYGQVLMPNPTRLPVGHAWQVWPDTVPPSSSVDPITPYWRNSQPLQIGAMVMDRGSGIANVTLWLRHSIDNSTWASWSRYSTLTSAPWSWSFSFPTGEGYYEFHTTAFDNVGNSEPPPPTADATTGYDVTPPVSTAMPISPYWHTTPSLMVHATATDGLSGVANVTLLYSHAPLGNASWGQWTSFGTMTSPAWSWPFPFPDGEGNYKFHTIATDNATNVEGSKNVAEAVAGFMTPPDYVPANPQPPSPQTIGLSLLIQLSVEARNQGGNASAYSTLSFFDSLAPTTPFASFQVPPIPAGGTSGPFTTSWTSPSTQCSCSVSAVVDSEDNVTESSELNNVYTWTVNVVPGPITSLIIGQPNYTSTVTYVKSTTPLDFSILDQSGLGIRNTTYIIDGGNPVNYTAAGTFFLAGEGMHTIEWRSLDWAENLEEVSSMDLTVDDTPPATAISIGEPKHLVGGTFVRSSTDITLSTVDGGVGSNTTLFHLWDGTWTSWEAYTSSLNLAGRDGTWFIELLSHDYLGNSETIQNETLILDDSPPITTFSPANGPYTTATVFTLTATDSGCGVNVTRYRIDGGSWTVYSGGFTLPEGAHNISYYSNDMLNNTETERWLVVTVEGTTTPPEVAVNYKPIIALIFAIILAVVGTWSSKRKPWRGGKNKKAVAKAFMTASLPFIIAEAGTGVVSLVTGQLSMPPLLGAGTAVDLAILLAGTVVSILRIVRTKPSGTGEAGAPKNR